MDISSKKSSPVRQTPSNLKNLSNYSSNGVGAFKSQDREKLIRH